MNLGAADFTDFSLWKKLNTESLIPASLVKTGLMAAGMTPGSVNGTAEAKGGIFARNSIKSVVNAYLLNTSVTSPGAISVTADEAAKITAFDSSVINSWGVLSGVSVTNTVEGGSSAYVDNSTISKAASGNSGNNLTVAATLNAVIDSTALSKAYANPTSPPAPLPTPVEGQPDPEPVPQPSAMGFVIAFNSIGWEPQNILFDAVDTLIGSPTIASAFGDDDGGMPTTAYIKNSDVDVAGDIDVSAVSAASIKAVNGNDTQMDWKNGFTISSKYGAAGSSTAVLLASNKVNSGASAYIDNIGQPTRSITAGGSVEVTTEKEGSITSDISIVSKTVAQNTIDDLTGALGNVADLLGAGDYDYTTQSGVRTIRTGDTVRLGLDFLVPEVNLDTNPSPGAVNIVKGDKVQSGNKIWIYTGSTTLTTLSGPITSATSNWQEVNLNLGEVYEYLGVADLTDVDVKSINFNETIASAYGTLNLWNNCKPPTSGTCSSRHSAI